MSVTGVVKDPDRLTMILTADFDVTAERAWRLFDDPRRLERWWGPPTYPATVVEHDLAPGGSVSYYMTGPQGDRHHGWWRVVEARPPRLLVVEDGFADASGTPATDPPATLMRVGVADRTAGGVTVTIESTFPSLEAMEQLVAMGMEEGIKLAVGQIDALLAAEPVG